jgi:hypothetical protein
VSHHAPPRSNHLNDVTARGVHIDDVGAIDPWMSASDALLSARIDHNTRQQVLSVR